jgi:hypothetical protein
MAEAMLILWIVFCACGVVFCAAVLVKLVTNQ